MNAFTERRAVAKLRLNAAVFPGVLAHGFTCLFLINTPEGINFGLLAILPLIAWLLTLFIILASLRQPVENLFLFVLPFSVLSLLLAIFSTANAVTPAKFDNGLVIHILTSIAAYSMLAMSACQSLLLAFQERSIRTKESIAMIRVLPPLETMEALLFQILALGFVLLTVAIGSGFLFLDDMFAQHIVHHTVLSSISWLAYGSLLAGHHLLGWRSSTAIRWSLTAFTLLVLGYLGSKFVIEFLLNG